MSVRPFKTCGFLTFLTTIFHLTFEIMIPSTTKFNAKLLGHPRMSVCPFKHLFIKVHINDDCNILF